MNGEVVAAGGTVIAADGEGRWLEAKRDAARDEDANCGCSKAGHGFLINLCVLASPGARQLSFQNFSRKARKIEKSMGEFSEFMFNQIIKTKIHSF